MTDNVLALKGIYKAFGGVPVLTDVDFNLERGSVHALVGGNGAGKSTLMKILTGVYFSDAGTIEINGKATEMNSYNDARKNGISIIFQELSLIPTLTVSQNIYLNKELKKGIILDKKEMNSQTEKLLASLGIEIDVEERIENLDVGICQLVEIAKALSENSSILVMDEPTSSLSDKETEVLFKIIGGLKEKGVSIVYISHRMNEILQIADEISVLCNGKIAACKQTSEFTMKSLIQCMMGGTNQNTMEWKARTSSVGEQNILEVSNLTLGSKLKDISFYVKQGEVVGLAGLMGSGRTETLETIFGKRKRDSGKIILNGKVVNFRNIKQAIDGGVALVPEDRRRQGLVLMHALKENMISTNFRKVMSYGLINKKKVKNVSESVIREYSVKTDNISTKMLNLSGGNQQKIVIAKWLNTHPKLLLMDEPTAGVDVGAKGEIINIIRNFVKEDCSVIFVSSELSEMMAICDRVLIFCGGRITGEFAHSDIQSEEVLQHAIQN